MTNEETKRWRRRNKVFDAVPLQRALATNPRNYTNEWASDGCDNANSMMQHCSLQAARVLAESGENMQWTFTQRHVRMVRLLIWFGVRFSARKVTFKIDCMENRSRDSYFVQIYWISETTKRRNDIRHFALTTAHFTISLNSHNVRIASVVVCVPLEHAFTRTHKRTRARRKCKVMGDAFTTAAAAADGKWQSMLNYLDEIAIKSMHSHPYCEQVEDREREKGIEKTTV